MNQSEFVFSPTNPLQDAFIWNTARCSCIDGGIASSKTTAGLIRLLILASEYPRSRWVVFRNTYLDLTHTTRRTFKDKVCPPGWIIRDVKEHTTLANKAEITWMHLDEMTEQSLRGLEINGAFGDQVEEIDPELIDILDSRLGRWQMSEWAERCPPYIWLTSNPKGHDAVYFRFHPNIVNYDRVDYFKEWDDAMFAKCKEMGFDIPKDIPPTLAAYSNEKAYFFGSTLINLPKLNEIEPTYVRNLLKKPESWKRVWIYGNRDFFEGTIHPSFRESIHVYDPLKFDPLKLRPIKRIMGWFDYGISHPTVLLLSATDQEGFHYFFHEYAAANRTISQHADEIRKLMGKYPIESIFADPAVFLEMTRDRKVMTKSVAEEYANYGISFVKADNNEDTSIEGIEELLQVDKGRMNPITKQLGSPKVFFSRSCAGLISEVQQQRRKEQRNVLTGEKEFLDERDDRVPDDRYDCLAGDTLVDTERGQIPIKHLVGTTGRVWSPAGWLEYRDCKKYREGSEVVEIITNDGRKIVCTPDHLFLTVNGWVRADSLTGCTLFDTIQTWKPLQLSHQLSKDFLENTITNAGITFNEKANFSIEKFTDLIKDISPQGTISTTSTEIPPTTVSKTWNVSNTANTVACTPKESRIKRLWQQCKKLLRNGMAVLLGRDGTNAITKTFFPSHMVGMLKKNASGVLRSLEQRGLLHQGLDFAPLNARHHGAGTLVLTMPVSYVNAVTDMLPINTLQASTAPRSAVIVTEVRGAGTQDSYCLTVNHPFHAFSVHGGIFVHNCLRYFANCKYHNYTPWRGEIRTPKYNSGSLRETHKPDARGLLR